MTDLSKVLPTKSATVEAIESYWKQRGTSEKPRKYLGASSIGVECSRQLWYNFRHCSAPNFDGRLYRLFNRGHREEATFVEELRGIGCEVHEFDNDGNQFEVIACDGHFKGHTDGAALGVPEAPKTWHLLEMKTASAKSFTKTKRDGVEKDKPQHFAQMQVYMHLTGLKRALYMVVNKDNDELYTERLKHDSKRAQSYIDKAQMIINASTPPERISDKPDSWACKFCDAKELCHGTSEDIAVPVPALSCRNCVYSTASQDGKWICDKTGNEAKAVCSNHLFIPALVGFAEPTDSLENKDGSAVIEFTSDDSTVWHHGNDRDAGQFSSHDLITLPRDLVTLPNAKKKETLHNLEARYSTALDNVESIWRGPVDNVRDEFEKRYNVPMSNPDATQDGDSWTAAEFRPHCCVIVYGNKAEIREDKN